MDEEIRRLRARAQRLAHGKAGSQVRYPPAFRRAAIALARMRVREGGSVARLAQEVGVSIPTLTKWLRPTAVSVLRPVAVTSALPPERRAVASAVLITPKGVRVEGLDRDTLVAVLHALG
jgi:transposase-like protein